MRTRIVLATLLGIALFSYASAQESQRRPTTWGIEAYYGVTLSILGSADIRHIGAFAAWAERAEPRLKSGRWQGRLVYEAYFERTHSNGAYYWPRSTSDSVGIAVLARYRSKKRHGIGMYFDGGLGIQHSNVPIYDLPSVWNSSPVAGVGASFDTGKYETMVGLRFQHVSNAGTLHRNPGQNAILITVGIGF